MLFVDARWGCGAAEFHLETTVEEEEEWKTENDGQDDREGDLEGFLVGRAAVAGVGVRGRGGCGGVNDECGRGATGRGSR